jgi:hypothetical protein
VLSAHAGTNSTTPTQRHHRRLPRANASSSSGDLLKASRAAAGESDFEKRMTEVLKKLGKIYSNQNKEENKKWLPT